MTDHLPQRDRRQRKRYLTKRNVLIAAVSALIVFGSVSIWNELNPSDDGLALVKERSAASNVEVVREAEPYQRTREVPKATSSSDALWIDRPRKEEILGVDPRDQYQQDPRYTRIETSQGALDEPRPAISSSGGDEPFLGQRSDRSKSRVKISGTGNSLTLSIPPDDEG